MKTLFSEIEQEALGSVAPLAVRVRPRILDEIVGQDEVLGQGSWLRNAIEGDSLTSVIFFGPAGTGKTTLARVIAAQTKAHFTEVSAISGGVSDLRRVIDEASARLTHQNIKTILFVDEIHRFSRSQQDALLHAVEDRVVILIGATTENPAFEVNSALISRSRVIEFKALLAKDLEAVIGRALTDEQGLAGGFSLDDEALGAIVIMAGGDARSALTTLELAAEMATRKGAPGFDSGQTQTGDSGPDSGQTQTGNSGTDSGHTPTKDSGLDTGQAPTEGSGLDTGQAQTEGSGSGSEQTSIEDSGQIAAEGSDRATENGAPKDPGADHAQAREPLLIELADVMEAAPRTILPFDKKGDMHYDVISAFIKSMRGSDPDAVVYWLARMLDGGEDPKFIARRIMIFASEDIGNADPQALLIAHAAFAAVERIGLPECRINLSQAAVYMALAPKSNAAIHAIDKALAEVSKGPLRHVPNHLRDRHRPGSEDYGAYQYPHLDPSGYVEQQYLPDGLGPGSFYTPGERGWEAYRTEQRSNDKKTEGRG